jgi:glycosyltransferase involved in cell wall biosynthesis
VVIDQVNTFPFFTTLWSEVPVFMLIHQLAREVWWYESRFPVSAIGYLLEPLFLRCYRNANVFTVSESTKRDLRNLGFKGRVVVVPEGLETINSATRPKPLTPTFLYVGRLAPSKRVSHVIEAFASFTRTVGTAHLSIVGTGPSKYVARLRRLAVRLHVEDSVRFAGWVPAKEKHELMAASHMLLVTSVREGWGLVVLEANACGTPAVVYDVPGLRDAVHNGDTGLVVRASPDELATGMERLWTDRETYMHMASRSLDWSHGFSFDTTARIVERELAQVLAS